MIKVEELTKKYGSKNVVDNLSLSIKKGEIFGLLGPNGAGKTTTIKLLTSLIKADSGSAKVAGYDVTEGSSAFKYSIAYVAQYFGLYEELTVLDNVKFYTSLYREINEESILKLLEKYQLLEFKKSRASSLSGGYKRRLSLVCALSHDPDVLFLDEPTAGIDPVTRKALWDIFYELSQEGKTLFVTTHYMEEAERCNRILFLDKGKKVIEGTPSEVKKSLSDFTIYICKQVFDFALIKELKKSASVHLVNQFGDELRVIVKNEFSQNDLQTLMQPYIKGEVKLFEGEANLEDIFIALSRDNENN